MQVSLFVLFVFFNLLILLVVIDRAQFLLRRGIGRDRSTNEVADGKLFGEDDRVQPRYFLRHSCQHLSYPPHVFRDCSC